MKNQYLGDVNDYRKYGLLRALQGAVRDRLLVAWMLTPDDGSRDGGFRSYLEDPGRWRRYDPELFDGIAGLLRSSPAPDVSGIECSGLLPDASYYPVMVPDGRGERELWRRGLLQAAGDAGWVFLDPDNGIEVASKPVGRKGSSKYVTWGELEALWSAGCSLLIYQHFRREPREPFARRLISELRRWTGARCTEAFRTPHVLFLLVAQPRHAERFREGIRLVSRRWNAQIRPMGLANGHGT
ncbi:MAG TPA: hypothetical protein ENK19_10670 [Acidobacteria bacterium]|nr:hypothetical protein [Acidobacteriota bacterium]